MVTVINKKEVTVFGIKRSGNHAIIHWLLQLLGDQTVHLNDVTGESPYESCREINAKGLPMWSCKWDIKNFFRLFSRNTPVIEYSMRDRRVNWNFIHRFSPKDALILSYENCSLEEAVYSAFLQQHDIHVGKSYQQYRVIILRDAFNLFASLHRATFMTPEDMVRCVELYKEYAEVFLSTAKQAESNAICVKYNDWVSSPEYRIRLARKFGIESDGGPFLKVPSIAGGSSFEGMTKDGRAQGMKVFERWKVYWDDPVYRSIFQDKQLVDLTNDIFGRIVP